MENEIKLRPKENHVDTNGVMIDTYFCSLRDSNPRLVKQLGKSCTAHSITHTDEVSTVSITILGATLNYRLYKKKARNGLVAVALTAEVVGG